MKSDAAIALLLFPVLLLFFTTGCSQPPEQPSVDITEALSRDKDDACYEKADKPMSLVFPSDLGPHDRFKTEWWYYTGNLSTEAGRHFGFQLTFFRQALSCESRSGDQPGPSAWRTRQLYFSHFALTDTRNQAFYSAQRMNRGAVGIAGAQSQPFKVWIDDWTASAGHKPTTIALKAGDSIAALKGQAPEPISIGLELTRTKPAILQGQKGWSQKGPGRSDASYYYSFPGMAAQGNLVIGQSTHKVSGHAWFDHEWSTSALGNDVAGWDWFAVHLDTGPHKGVDIMVCQVRSANGNSNGFGFGSISFADGRYLILKEKDFSIRPLAYWTSPRTQKRYPSKWTLTLKDHGISLEAVTVLPDQEHPHDFSYYEGAIQVKGKGSFGMGYVEMTGYK